MRNLFLIKYSTTYRPDPEASYSITHKNKCIVVLESQGGAENAIKILIDKFKASGDNDMGEHSLRIMSVEEVETDFLILESDTDNCLM